jgi:hypothetical protein
MKFKKLILLLCFPVAIFAASFTNKKSTPQNIYYHPTPITCSTEIDANSVCQPDPTSAVCTLITTGGRPVFKDQFCTMPMYFWN